VNNKYLPSRPIVALILLVTLTASAFFVWRSNANTLMKAPEDIEDYLFWEARDLADFQLTAADNSTFDLDSLKGKWSFIFFGYTHCPDVCPATLMQLGTLFDILEQKSPAVFSQLQGVFISVDPKRDTPALLRDYVSYFNKGFIGLTGNKAQIDAFSRQIGALYSINAGQSESDYEVTHNSTLFLIDPQGRLYGHFSPPQNAPEIAESFIKIHAFYRQQSKKQWAFF
jgi:protein SCO1/2